MSRVAVSTVALLTVAASIPAATQGRTSQPTTRPGWKPRRISISGDITPAQRAAAIANLEAIERIFLRVPELAHPEDFVISPLFSGVTRKLGFRDAAAPGNVLEYRLLYDLCDPRVKDYGCGSIEVAVNFVNPPGAQPIHDEAGRVIYIEAPRGDSYRTLADLNHSRDTVPFATETYYRLSPTERSWVTVLFTSGGELPWKPVTREEFYNATIFDVEGKGGEKLAEFRKANEKSPYQQWLAGAAQRKKEREEALAAVAGVQTSAEVAKMRKVLEDTERETGEQLKAKEAADPDANKKALDKSSAYQDAIRAELAAMTPAQRRQPAVVDPTLKTGPMATGYALTDRDVPNALRVLTPNLDFWRARRSAVEVRGISVHISASSGAGPPPPSVHNALWQTFKKLDWAAINQLVDKPR